MDVIREDSALASEMVALLGRELKSIKKRNQVLEKELQDEKLSRGTNIERGEASEVAMKALMLNMEEMGKENQALRAELNQRPGLAESEKLFDPSLSHIEDALAQNKKLQKRLTLVEEECEVEKKERQRLYLACCNLERDNERLRIEKEALVGQLEGMPHAVRSVEEAEPPEGGNRQEMHINEPKGTALSKEDIALLREFFRELPKVAGVVTRRAICAGPHTMVSNLQLTYDARLWRWSKSLLYVPHSFFHSHYALAFFPSHNFQDGQWLDAVFDYEGQTREVFRTYRDETFYSGTYLCHDPPSEWFGESGPLSGYLARARSQITKLMNDSGLNPPPQLYLNGVLRVKCLALRYAGHNSDISAKLNPMKRKADESTPRPPKRLRV